ncbi:hypothetical protein MES4922_550039 [Mesorhizobium ventifaucium]|uniref:Uncharacterized protein n=1 Tax=Mesorhizobium ventifaucium TaxID=666020 RepID=A0ABM9EC35_9HYPH|nr:hypothetical protein MES4922_550039 [Mesorhizobium ventifaucium]
MAPAISPLMEAVQATCGVAETLPFATLAPDTLVWKLAGVVTMAATGENPTLDHVFAAKDLPALFEQCCNCRICRCLRSPIGYSRMSRFFRRASASV